MDNRTDLQKVGPDDPLLVRKHVVSVYDSANAYNGYTLFGPMGSREVYLVDMEGRFVHRWQLPHRLGLHGRLLSNGNLLVGQRISDGPLVDLPGSAGLLLEVEWDGTTVWEYEDLQMCTHDFWRMENGNTVLGHWEPMPAEVVAEVQGGIPGTERDGVMWGERFQEISPSGEVLWDWAFHEHADFEIDRICPLCGRETYPYVNSLSIMPDGNLLFNARSLNTVFIVNKASGDIVWRWGSGELAHAHNPSVLENGNILVFDNGCHRSIEECAGRVDFSYTRVLEVTVDTKKIHWEYIGENPMAFYSSICGSAQRLPNGNTLICDSTKGRIFEVTAGKQIVWEFISPFYTTYRSSVFGINNMIFRAYRYGPEHPALSNRSLDPEAFGWGLVEKTRTWSTKDVDAVNRRLERLGY